MLKLWKPLEKLAWWRMPSDEEGPKPLGWAWPQVEMTEVEGATDVKIAVAGMTPEDVEVRVENGALVVRGRREEKKEEEGRTYHRVETFFRRIPLPAPIDENAIETTTDEGGLTVHVPHLPVEKAA